VNYGWSGTTTPSKTNYTFSPSSRSYTNVTSDKSDNDYEGTYNPPPPTPPAKGGDGTCLIATAAYGSPMHPYVTILRDFRDRYLLPSKLGRMLVDFYYKHSPFLASLIQKHEDLKFVARICLIPLVVLCNSMVNFGS